jgi:hypothetical protein
LLADMEELLTRIDVVGEEIAEGNQCQEQECDCGSNFHFTLSLSILGLGLLSSHILGSFRTITCS